MSLNPCISHLHPLQCSIHSGSTSTLLPEASDEKKRADVSLTAGLNRDSRHSRANALVVSYLLLYYTLLMIEIRSGKKCRFMLTECAIEFSCAYALKFGQVNLKLKRCLKFT